MAEAEQVLNAEAATSEPSRPKARKPSRLSEIIPVQMKTLNEYHRAVLDLGDVEAVHKMRVTTRRLQASLDLLEGQFKVRRLKRRLRAWRRALSQVRNYDVFLEMIEKEASARRRAHREQFELVKSILEGRRTQRAVKVKKYLESVSVTEIATGLGLSASVADEQAQDNNLSVAEDVKPVSVDPVQATLVVDEVKVAEYAAERLDQRLAEFQALVATSHPTTDPTELHQLRIAAKRIRYLLEIVAQMGFGNTSSALAWLRRLQDRIGDWHDFEALEEEIITIVSSRKFTKAHLAESSRMLQAAAHLQRKKEALVARLFPVRVPRYLEATSRRVARMLRRRALSASRGST